MSLRVADVSDPTLTILLEYSSCGQARVRQFYAMYIVGDLSLHVLIILIFQVRSPIAASFGLGISLQERLMTLPHYGQTSTISPYPLSDPISTQSQQQQQQHQQQQQRSSSNSAAHRNDAALTEATLWPHNWKDLVMRNHLPYTQLTSNYRSHRVLLEVPSRLFYGGSLVEKGDRALVDSLRDWEGLTPHNTTAQMVRSCDII